MGVGEEEENSGIKKSMEQGDGGGVLPEFSSSSPTPSPIYACYAGYIVGTLVSESLSSWGDQAGCSRNELKLNRSNSSISS